MISCCFFFLEGGTEGRTRRGEERSGEGFVFMTWGRSWICGGLMKEGRKEGKRKGGKKEGMGVRLCLILCLSRW